MVETAHDSASLPSTTMTPVTQQQSANRPSVSDKHARRTSAVWRKPVPVYEDGIAPEMDFEPVPPTIRVEPSLIYGNHIGRLEERPSQEISS